MSHTGLTLSISRFPRLAESFRNAEDNAAIAEAYCEHGYTMKEIADHLGFHLQNLSPIHSPWVPKRVASVS